MRREMAGAEWRRHPPPSYAAKAPTKLSTGAVASTSAAATACSIVAARWFSGASRASRSARFTACSAAGPEVASRSIAPVSKKQTFTGGRCRR
jgi:hypothetical protein